MLIKVILTLVGLLVGAGVMFPVAVNYRKRTAERKSAARKRKQSALSTSPSKARRSKKREMLVEAKEEIHQSAYRVR